VTIALCVFAVLTGVVGLVMTANVAAGPSIIGFACLLAILARIHQASVRP
jgi:hypothetical protein